MGAIGQSGEGVEVTQVGDLRGGALGGAQVAEDRHVLRRPALGVEDAVDLQPRREDLAVLAPVPDLPTPGTGGLQLVPEVAEEGGVVPPGIEQGRIAPQDLRRGVAGKGGEGGVDRQDAVVGIGDEDALAGVVEQGADEPLLGLSGVLLGDVMNGAQAAGHPPASVREMDCTLAHPAFATVGPADAMLDLVGGHHRQGLLVSGADRLPVLGVDHGQEVPEIQGGADGLAEDPIGLVGPYQAILDRVVFPTPQVSQGLGLEQAFLGTAKVADIVDDGQGLGQVAGRIMDRRNRHVGPDQPAIPAPVTTFHLVAGDLPGQ